MVKVEYRPDTYLGVLKIDEENRLGLESLMSSVVTEIVSGIDTSKADRLIITDNFAEDVLAFQNEHNYTSTGITDNEVARAQGKTLIDRETGLYTVILNSDFGVTLVDDEMFDLILRLAPGREEEARIQRAVTRNLVAHEFTHVEFESTHVKPTFGDSYHEQLKSVAWLLYDEYNACRNAASIEPTSFIPDEEKYVQEIERIVMSKRRSYNLRSISMMDFALLFSEYTRLALIYMASSIGDSEGAKREPPEYPSCKAREISMEMADALHAMGEGLDAGNHDDSLDVLSDVVRRYHEQFHVYISNPPEGEYWDIPVELW